jgi:rRNA maturation protein Nop10
MLETTAFPAKRSFVNQDFASTIPRRPLTLGADHYSVPQTFRRRRVAPKECSHALPGQLSGLRHHHDNPGELRSLTITNVVCDYCGHPDHVPKVCRTLHNVCPVCGIRGHIQGLCPAPFELEDFLRNLSKLRGRRSKDAASIMKNPNGVSSTLINGTRSSSRRFIPTYEEMLNAPIQQVLMDLRIFDFIEYLSRTRAEKKQAYEWRDKPANKMETISALELDRLKRKAAKADARYMPAEKKAKPSYSNYEVKHVEVRFQGPSTSGSSKARAKPAEALGRAPDSTLPPNYGQQIASQAFKELTSTRKRSKLLYWSWDSPEPTQSPRFWPQRGSIEVDHRGRGRGEDVAKATTSEAAISFASTVHPFRWRNCA